MKAIRIVIQLMLFTLPLILFIIWINYIVKEMGLIEAIGTVIFGIFIAVKSEENMQKFVKWFNSKLK